MNSSSSQSFLARRTNSATSLAQFYHDATESQIGGVGQPAEMDFCNAFWGPNDAGYEVLMARIRASARTIEELKNFWKERASIEEEYGKRLTKLAKTTLGRDEIGDLRQCLESLRGETEKQASARVKLASEIRKDVENPTNEFSGRLTNLKKTYQASIEKSYKNKVAQEGYVAKARERYEQDCLRINAFTANSSIVQGKELDKLQKQMEKVQATVGNNEKEFRGLVKLLEQTTVNWESDWKGFCDHVQDLEEERMEFVKDNVWLYANAVSSVCVTDDESCERIRVSLEGFESASDIEAFVKSYGTGPVIPEPPAFVDYSKGEAYNENKPSRTARFTRHTTRSSSHPPIRTETQPELPTPPAAETRSPAGPAAAEMVAKPVPAPQINGYGPPPVAPKPAPPVVQQQQPPPSASASSAPFGGVALPGMAHRPFEGQAATERSASPAPPPSSSYNPPTVRPPSAFNRPTSAAAMRSPPPTGPAAFRQSADQNAEEDDPVARSLAELRRDPPPAGSIRRGPSARRPESTHPASRNSVQMPPRSPAPPFIADGQKPDNRMSYQGQPSGRGSVDTSLVPPAAGHTAAALAQSLADHEKRSSRLYNQGGPPQDYNAAANDIVGQHPASRPTTPSGQPAPRTPSPVFMQAPTQAPSHIDDVLGQYHQAFPGERASRGPSRAGSISSRHSRAHSVGNVAPPAAAQPRSPSPAAREGFVGIGSGNVAARASSPLPGARPTSTGANGVQPPYPAGVASVAPLATSRSQQGHAVQPPQQARPASIHTGQQPQPQATGQIPGLQPAGLPPQSTRYSTYSGSPAPQVAPLSVSHRSSTSQYASMPSATGQHVQPVQYSASPQPAMYPAYAAPPPPATVTSPVGYDQYGRPYGQAYGMAPQVYGQPLIPPVVPPGQPTPAQQYAATVAVGPSPQPNGQYRPPVSTAPAAPAAATAPYQPPAPQGNQYARTASPAPASQPAYYQPQQQPQPQAPVPQTAYARAASPAVVVQQQAPVQRSPSPVPPQAPVDAPPTGQYSTTGQPILFFKALYDYEAQSDAEFDFQVGDIIAVTHTPADGWWSGELLDEARRQPGRTDFPSNFVCLF